MWEVGYGLEVSSLNLDRSWCGISVRWAYRTLKRGGRWDTGPTNRCEVGGF